MRRQEEERREKETDPKHNRRIELLRKSEIIIMMVTMIIAMMMMMTRVQCNCYCPKPQYGAEAKAGFSRLMCSAQPLKRTQRPRLSSRVE